MATETRTGGRSATAGVIGGGTAIAVGKPPSPTPDGFEWTALAQVARLETGHTPSRRHPEYWDGEVPWIGIKDATSNHGRTIHSTLQTVTEAGIANSSARMLPAGTVCLSRTASVGYVVVMGVPMSTSQDFVNWVCGPELDNRYLKYVLQLERETLLRFASGTTHQTIYFPEAKAFHALLPHIDQQRAIADVVGVLDDKIESNGRMCHSIDDLLLLLLEAKGRDVKRERTSLGSLTKLAKGVSYRSSELSASTTAMVSLKCVGRTGEFQFEGLKEYVGTPRSDQVVTPGELIVAQTDLTQGADVVGRVLRVPASTGYERLVASLDLVVVRPLPGIEQEYLYVVMLQPGFRSHCRARTNGTTVLHLASDALPQYEFGLDPPEVREAIVSTAQPLLAERDRATSESRTLSALRDALLPEVLSGRLRVPMAEELVEAAT